MLPITETPEVLSLIKNSSSDALLQTAFQLAQHSNVADNFMKQPEFLTGLIHPSISLAELPFALPGDDVVVIFLQVIQKLGVKYVAQHENFKDSHIGVFVNYICKYDRECLSQNTQNIAKELLAELKHQFLGRDEHGGVQVTGLDDDQAQEAGALK